MGRRTLLEERPELTDQICKLIEEGNYAETAAQACGVTVRSYFNWMRRGEAGEQPFEAFFQAVTRARASGEVALVQTVRGGDGVGTSFGPAKAALEILSRTRPQRFGSRVNVAVREQLGEFMRFLEATLGDVLGHEKGEAVFLELSDRWLNRQPVEVSEEHGGSDDGGSGSESEPILN